MANSETVPPEVDDAILEAAAAFQYDPDAWAAFAWDWGHGALAGSTGAREWQSAVFKDIRDHLSNPQTRYQPLQIAVSSGHGPGKVCRLDMPVETPSGRRLWGDLVVGDFIFGADGAPTQVVATNPNQTASLRVHFDDGSYCDTSPQHLWTVRGRQERRKGLATWRTLETQEIIRLGVQRPNGVAMARQWEIPIQGAAQFDEREIDLHPYVLGVWLGDGSKGHPVYTKPYPEIAEKIRSLGYEVTTGANGKTHRIGGCADMFDDPVFAYGSHERYIPDDYKYNTVANRRALLEGLCDTDGECSRDGTIGYASTSKRLAEDVIWLARSLGCKAMMQPAVKQGWYLGDDGERVICRPCWRVTINAPFNPFTLKHRRERYKPSESRYLTRWIDRIEPIEPLPGMCVTVAADDGLYLANDFIVTHNSSAMGMISNWAMSCFEDARIVATANTDNQLRTKTSPEFGKWFRMAINAHWWDIQGTSIKSRDPRHRETWRVDFVPWSEHNTEAFAGLHNKDKIIVLLFDEASKIADNVWEVAEGALTDENTIIIWIVFGNPTRATGRFRECFRKYRHRWIGRKIDSRDVPGTNKAKIAEWVADHGEDSDFVKVRVRGEFPSQSAMQFIAEEDADKARAGYEAMYRNDQSYAPKIIGVDPAWTGHDTMEIMLRQGLYSKHLRTIARNDDDVAMATLIATLEDEHEADGVIVDAGYGTGIVSVARAMGRTWHLVWFGSTKTPDPGCLNMRSYIWKQVRDWLKAGGVIDPKDDILYGDLTNMELVERLDGKLQLESKEDMRERGMPSPGRGDALAVTFAVPIAKKQRAALPGRRGHTAEYDPYANLPGSEAGRPRQYSADYNPHNNI